MSLLNFDKSTMENISRRFTPGCCFTMTLIRREMDDYGRHLKMTRRVAMQTIFLPGFGYPLRHDEYPVLQRIE
jgi:hypothetical protein